MHGTQQLPSAARVAATWVVKPAGGKPRATFMRAAFPLLTMTGVWTPGARKKSAQVRCEMSWVTCAAGKTKLGLGNREAKLEPHNPESQAKSGCHGDLCIEDPLHNAPTPATQVC